MSFTDELLARSPLSKTDDIERDIGDLIQISHPALPSIHIVPNDDHPLPKGPMPANFPPKPLFANTMRL